MIINGIRYSVIRQTSDDITKSVLSPPVGQRKFPYKGGAWASGLKSRCLSSEAFTQQLTDEREQKERTQEEKKRRAAERAANAATRKEKQHMMAEKRKECTEQKKEDVASTEPRLRDATDGM